MKETHNDKNHRFTTPSSVALVEELRKANKELQQARRAALNLMEDAILSKEALRISEEKYRTKLEQEVRDRTAELKASRDLLQATMNASMDMIQVFKAVRNDKGEIVDFTYVLTNHEADKWLPDAVGTSLLQRQPGVVEEGIFDAFKEVVETGVPQQYEKHYVHEQFNGWFYQSVVKLGDGVATTTRNITARKKAEQELQESKALVQEVIDAPHIGIAVFRPVRNEAGAIVDFVHESINRASVAMLGEDFTGRLLSDHGESGTTQLQLFTDVIQNGKGNSYVREIDFRGQRVWFAVTNTPLSGDRLVHTREDVTSRKNAEAELLRLKEEAAQRSEDKYRAIFNSINEGFILLEILFNKNGDAEEFIFRDANPAQERIDGVRATIGKRVREIFPDMEPKWMERFAAVAKSGEPMNFEDWTEANQRWYRVSASRVGAEGSPLVAIVYDNITERKRREQAQALLSAVSQQLVAHHSMEETMQVIGQKLGAYFNLTWCVFSELIENAETSVSSYDWHHDRVPSLSGIYRMRDFLSDEQLAKHNAGEVSVVSDTYNHPHVNGENYGALGIRSFIMVPLALNGEWKFLLSVIDTKPREWRSDEIDLVKEITARIWIRLERARAEEALQQSQRRFQSIANLVPDLLWDSEPNGSTNWLNQRWLEYTGQSLEQATGWGWVDAIHPDDQEGSAKRYHDAVVKGKPLRQEHRIRRYDGEYRWFVVHAVPVKDEKGNVIKMYGTATDIQYERELLQTVRKSEVRLRTLADAVPQVIWTNNADGKADYFNQRWYEYTGLSRKKSVGPGWQAVVHPGDAPASIEKWQRALAAGEIFDTEYRLRRYDGTYRWFIGRNVPLKASSGNVTGWFGSATDVHELKETEEALGQSEARLRVTMESVLDYAIITMDTERNIQRWSKGAEQLFGFTESEVIGQSADIIFTPEDRQAGAPEREMETAKSTGRAIDERWHQRKDGSRVFVSGVMTPIYDGTLTGYVKVTRDVTQQQLFTEQLHRLVAERTRELQQSNESLEQFATIAAHDLQEPLRKLRLFSSVLQRYKESLAGEGAELLGKIYATSERMSQLISEVLQYSKIAYGKEEFATTDLDVVFQSVLRDLELKLEETGATIVYETPLPTIEAVPTQMNQLFYNLLGNALKFRRKAAKPVIQISFRSLAADAMVAYPPLPDNKEHLEIRFADNGIGFDEQFSEQIFQIFERLHSLDDYEGTGVGLALCKKIVENHHGHIFAQSKEGEGATFIVVLPVQQAVV